MWPVGWGQTRQVCGRVIYKVFVRGNISGECVGRASVERGEICDKDEKSNWFGHQVDRGGICLIKIVRCGIPNTWSGVPRGHSYAKDDLGNLNA